MSVTASADLTTSVLEGLALLHADGEMFEVRSLLPSGRVDAGCFTSVEKAAAAIEAHIAAGGNGNYYVTLNPVDPARINGAAVDRIQQGVKTAMADKDIARRRHLLIDVDPRRSGNTSSTDAELQQALERRDHVVYYLTEFHGWPEPVRTMSGNGGHAVYELDLPAAPETDLLIKSVLKAIAAIFSDDDVTVDTTVGNASRIVKVPGTFARKGTASPERPHRRAEIEQVPDDRTIVTLEQLQTVAATLTPVNSKPSPKVSSNRTKTSSRDQTIARATAYLRKVPGAVEGQGGDLATYNVACVLTRDFGLDHGDAFSLLSEWNSTCCPPWSTADLHSKLAGALKYGSGLIGSKVHEEGPTPSTSQLAAKHHAEPAIEVSSVAAPFSIDLNRLTDAHAAELLAQQADGTLRYDHQQGQWYEWQSPVWREDVTGARHRAVVRLARAIAQHALTIDDLEVRKRVLKFALGLESRRGTENVLELTKHQPPIACTSESWDRDPWSLNTPTGTINLRTGEARAAVPADLFRHCTGAIYVPGALAPRFQDFLQQIFAGDEPLIAYVQRLLGYALTGDVREQMFNLSYGLGANGKSVLLAVVGFVWGSYAHVAPFAAFAQRYNDGGDVPSPELAALKGKRFIAASETRDGTRLDEGRVKNLTGGDTITTRYLFGKYFSFKVEGKIFLAANHRPKVTDDSLAFWRRCHVLPFGQSFTGAAANPALADELRGEASGILNWALAGCRAWQEQGLNPPAAVHLASASYREANDALAGFLRDCTDATAEPTDTALTRDAFAAYKKWADREGLADRERLGVRAFGERLGDKGFTRFHSQWGASHRGLRLLTK